MWRQGDAPTWHVRRQHIGNTFLQVFKDQTTLSDAVDNGAKVVIQQHLQPTLTTPPHPIKTLSYHLRSLFSHLGPRPHLNTKH